MVSEIYKFNLTQLKSVLEEVKKLHTHEYHGEKVISDKDPALEKLIKRIVSLKQSELRREAILLEEREQLMVTQYIPHNYFDVDMENVYSIFKYFISDMLSEVLFKEWLDSYDVAECNKFISDLCLEEETFSDCCRKLGLNQQLYIRFLQADDVPSEVCKYLKEVNDNSKTFAEKLNDIGIEENTALFNICEFAYYMFCSKYDYLCINVFDLKAVVIRYVNSKKNLKQFIENFMTCLSLDELDKYHQLVPAILPTTGKIDSNQFRTFCAGYDVEVIRKLRKWIQNARIITLLGTERGYFWSKYDFISVIDKYVENAEMIVMEAEKYVVIEFINEGFAYFFEKEQFMKEEIKKIHTWDSEQDVKHYLNHLSKHEDKLKHYRPKGDSHGMAWQHTFEGFISFNDIVKLRKEF